MKKTRGKTTHDLFGEVKQSASDKIIGSVSYPLTVLEKNQAFPGCTRLMAEMGARDEAGFYEYTKKEISEMLSTALTDVSSSQTKPEVTVSSDLYTFAGSIIQQAKSVIDASIVARDEYEGPNVAELQKIVDGGINNLVNTLGDWGVYAWNPHLRVVLEKTPRIGLRSPRIDLNGIEIRVTATGELWAKYPWWNCYKWCTKWKKVIKCTRIASATISVKIKAEAHAVLLAEGAKILARGAFDKLRLNYPILDKIALEGIANKVLADKLVYVYDASQLVASVPLLKSKFSVHTLTLPGSADGVGVGVTVKQV